jgi:hypothetical protein
LRRKTANRGSVESQVVPALDQELFIVIEHVQAAFEVAEQQGNGFDALLIGQILETAFPDLLDRSALQTLLLGFEI